jgi:hypothetical protein
MPSHSGRLPVRRRRVRVPLKRQMVVRCAERHEDEARADSFGHLEPEGAPVELLGAIEVGDLEVHMADDGQLFS